MKKEREKNVISAHLGIDPGPLVPKSDTLTTGHDVKSCAARNNSTYWTDNPSICYIRIRIQGKNFEIFYIVDVACPIYLYLVLRRSVLMKGQLLFWTHFSYFRL